MSLSEREKRVLDVERGWWLGALTKEQVIREQLGCSPTSYYAALRRLAASSDAFEYDPLLVARVRRRLDERRRARVAAGSAAPHRPR